MALPWENYAAQSQATGPWSKYAAAGNPEGKGDLPPGPPDKSVAGFGENAVSDAYDQLSGLVNMVRHPIDTFTNTGKLMVGGAANAWNAVAPDSMQVAAVDPEGQSAIDMATNVGHQLKDNYGSLAGIENTLYEHPVGSAIDIASLLTGGEGLARKVGMDATANAMKKAATIVNPASLPAAAVSKGIDIAATPFRGRFAPASVAKDRMANIIEKSGLQPADVVSATSQAAAEGQPMFTAADAMGDVGQQALSTVTRRPNDMRQTIVDTLLQRQAGQGDRLGSFVADASGTDKTAKQTEAALKAARGQVADTNYTAMRANAGPADPSSTIALIDNMIGNTKKFDVGIAPDSTEATLLNIRKRLGAGSFQNGVTTRTDFQSLLNTKRDLSDLKDSLYQQGKTNQANAVRDVMQSLDKDLEAASPDYRTANDTFAQMSRPIEAVDTGRDAAAVGRRSADNIDTFTKLSPEEQQGFRAGYADKLQTKFEGGAQGENKARPLTSDKIQEEISSILANPDLLKRRIARENTMFDTKQRATGGSLTFDNSANEAEMFDPASLINAFRKEGVRGAIGHVVKGAFDFATGESPKVREEIAKALLGPDPAGHFSQVRGSSQSVLPAQGVRAAILRALLAGQLGQVSSAP